MGHWIQARKGMSVVQLQIALLILWGNCGRCVVDVLRLKSPVVRDTNCL
jgi:hypothetical protein